MKKQLDTEKNIMQVHKNKLTLKQRLNNPYYLIIIAVMLILSIQFLGIAGILNPSTLTFFTQTLIYFIAALGFTLLLGYSGLATLGTAGFLLIGSFSIAILNQSYGLSIELSVIVGLIISLLLGLIVGFISLRIEGMYLAIVTLGISEIILDIAKKWDKAGAGNTIRITRFSFLGIKFSQTARFSMAYYFIAIAIGILLFLLINLINSPTGRAMLGMKNSSSAAQAMGINIVKYRLIAFMIATFTAVLAGILNFLKFQQTNLSIGLIGVSLNLLAAVVIGGMKSPLGIFIGTFIVFSLNDLVLKTIPFFNNYPSAFYIINGTLIIIIIMFYPGGIMRLFSDLKSIMVKIKGKWKEYRYGKDEEHLPEIL